MKKEILKCLKYAPAILVATRCCATDNDGSRWTAVILRNTAFHVLMSEYHENYKEQHSDGGKIPNQFGVFMGKRIEPDALARVVQEFIWRGYPDIDLVHGYEIMYTCAERDKSQACNALKDALKKLVQEE